MLRPRPDLPRPYRDDSSRPQPGSKDAVHSNSWSSLSMPDTTSSDSSSSTATRPQLTQAIEKLDKLALELGFFNNNNMSSSTAEVRHGGQERVSASTKMVDDLTEQLVHALDTNEVVGWKSSEESPFGDCSACGKMIAGEASVVGKTHYHPECFRCADCHKPLGTAKYYIIGGNNYCSDDRFKFLECCNKCGKFIEAETLRPKETGKPYHPECFACSKCGRALQGKYFHLDNETLCEEDFAAGRDKCHRCNRPIMESTLKALGNKYHPKCFICSMCPRSLDGIEFFVTEDNQPMCKEDYARFIAKTCDECHRKIVDETVISTNSGKFFHRECYNK